MKKLILLCAALLVILLPAYLCNASCDGVGVVSTIGEPRTLLFATPDVETGDTPPNNYVMIIIEGILTGTYKTIEAPLFTGSYYINGEEWEFYAMTLKITTFEAVGGVIEGTFSGTIQTPLAEYVAIVGGQFRVKRIADNSFSP